MAPEFRFGSSAIPPRTLLISPAPIGLGSAEAESLFSYFCRVAAQNGLTPGQLVFGQCTALLAQRHNDAAMLRRTARAALASRTASVSETGYEFAAALAQLVGRPEVMRMNWRHALNGYSFARMTRGFGAHCPGCLRSDSEPHTRMAWDLMLFGACTRHRCILVSRCGRCARRASRYGLSGRLWECPLCGHDLRLDQALPAASAEIASAEALGAIVAEATAPTSADYLTAPDCVDRLLDWAGTHGALSVKRLAKFFGMSVGTMSLWRNKRSRPAAARLMELALRRGFPLPALFRGECSRITLSHATPEVPAVWKRRRLTHPERLALRIRTEALANMNPMRPMPDVAAELGISPRTLRQVAPDLYSQIKANYAANRRRIKEAKLEWFCRKVDDYIAACLAKRQHPTWPGLSLAFEKPGILRDEVRRFYAKQAIRRGQELLPSVPEQLQLDILG